MPQIFMIAGPNGAGKTTSAMTLLPDTLTCKIKTQVCASLTLGYFIWLLRSFLRNQRENK